MTFEAWPCAGTAVAIVPTFSVKPTYCDNSCALRLSLFTSVINYVPHFCGFEEGMGMAWYKVLPAVCAAVWLLVSPVAVYAQQITGSAPAEELAGSREQIGMETGRYYSVGFKKYFSSFTSYQFPNPFPPGADPLSRLEFPIDQWFAGLRSGYRTTSWSVDSQAWINTSRESRFRMQDSDWDDESMPGQKTIFSESKCRLNRGVLLDMAVGMIIPLEQIPNFCKVKGLVGYRYQSFYFTTHDGIQTILGDGSAPLDGDGIDFKQVFYHYYCGLNARTSLDPSGFVLMLPRVILEVQVDYGLVQAKNEDLHLLREGDRLTIQNTRGHCWHGFASVEFLALSDMRTLVEVDFKRSLTNGSHRLLNGLLDIDFSFEGSRVWSDQASISVTGELRF